jgi:iron(III) transport system permease protein
MSAAASFSAPFILDNSAHYLTVDIYNEGDDLGMQRAFSVMLAAIALSALPAFLWVNRRQSFGSDVAIGKGATRRSLPAASPRGAVLRVLQSLAAAVVLLAPLALVVDGAATRPDGSSQNILQSISALNSEAWASLGRSGWYAAVAALIDILLALAIALSLRRAAGAAVFSVELCVMLALALPGSSVAVSLLTAFNGPSLLAFGQPLGRTAAILIIAYAIRTLPLAVRPARAALQAIGSDLELAAAGLGARRPMVLSRVIVPLIFPSLLAAALICFITSAGEYVASALLWGFRRAGDQTVSTRPVSVAIYELFRNTPASAYALALCLMLASAATIAVARVVRKTK